MTISSRDVRLTGVLSKLDSPTRPVKSSGLSIRDVQQLDMQTCKLIVEGQPISASQKLSIAEVFDFYRRLAEGEQGNAVEASLEEFMVADAPLEATSKG